MPTEMHWYSSGTWKKAQQMFAWDSGLSQWREAIRMYIWDGATWKLCHEYACFNFSATSVTSMFDCDTSRPFTYGSNCADPANDYTLVTCYLYQDSTCTTGTGDAYSQVQIGATAYNIDTDTNSVITSVATVPC